MSEQIVLPGLVDMHVHLREPGAEHKEDFTTGTRAAVAGGVTTLCDMPNNPGQPTNSGDRLIRKQDLAKGRVYADIGFYYGSQPGDENLGSFRYAVRHSLGLKSYLEITTGSDRGSNPQDFREIWQAWHRFAAPTQPIILHAEQRTIQEALALSAGQIGHPTHVAHISNRAELETVMWARRRGWPVTAGVTPHHLFLDERDVQTWYQRMKPPLHPVVDQEFLWRYIDEIDVVETDHAPHTQAEKDAAERENPQADPEHPVKCYGVPGLDAMLPMLVHAVQQEKLTRRQLVHMTNLRPRQILGLLPTRTHVKLRLDSYEFGEEQVWSKCGWSPYLGRLVTGRITEVTLRGSTIYDGRSFLGLPPQGRVLAGEDC